MSVQQMKDWQSPVLQQAFKGALSHLRAILPEHSSSLQEPTQQILPLQAFKIQASKTALK